MDAILEVKRRQACHYRVVKPDVWTYHWTRVDLECLFAHHVLTCVNV